MKLWQKDKASLREVEIFTVGKDREFDVQLAPFDVLGSISHVTMLESIGLLSQDEKSLLVKELQTIYNDIHHSPFKLFPAKFPWRLEQVHPKST